MASAKNDALRVRTVEGSVNLYDNQECIGTAADKAIAGMLSGFKYNILSNKERDEVYLRELRSGNHYIDRKNRATNEWWDRRRKYTRDQREPIRTCLQSVEDHPKVEEQLQRRLESQLIQTENYQDFGEFQKRRRELRPATPPKRYTLDDKKRKLRATDTTLDDWTLRRTQSTPCIQDTAGTLSGRYPRYEQLFNESCNLAKVPQANTYRNSMYNCNEGEEIRQAQKHKSTERVKNYDFAITRKNNHYSNQNKLTRSDAFYMRPEFAITNNSVKYNIINNEQRPFLYA